MVKFKEILKILFTKELAKKIIALVVLIGFIYLFKDFSYTFFLTFIFAFLFYSIASHFRQYIDKILDKIGYPKNKNKFFRKNFSINFFIVLVYIFFITIIIFIVYSIVPQIIKELGEIPKMVPIIANEIQDIKDKLEAIRNFNTEIEGDINQIVTSGDYEVLLNIFYKIRDVSMVFFQFVLALILSFIFLIDRKRLRKYLAAIKKSNFYFLHDEYKNIIIKIGKSFGLILKAQGIIASVNTILTLIGLFIIGYIYSSNAHFPYILTLGLIVFICGFVPVLGVFISSIPIIIIAYTMGSWQASLSVVLLVVIIHMIEAYYLNPKIVSSYLELPVSLTFVILLISEHMFGIAGLLIGVSLFYFIVLILADFDKVVIKLKKKIKKINSLDKMKEV